MNTRVSSSSVSVSSATPLRVMQVFSTYRNFIDYFYAKRPDLQTASSTAQTEALFRYGLFAPPTIAPYTGDLGCVPDLTFSNAEPLQRAWAKEQGIPMPQGGDWEAELLRQRIDAFKPDVLYVYSPYTFDSALRNRLTHQPRLVVSWRCATLRMNWDWSAFDVMLTSLPSVAEHAPKLGAGAAEIFPPGFPLWAVKELAKLPQDTDIVFVGTITGERRIAALDALAQGASKYGFSLALHLSGDFSHITPAMAPYLKAPVFGLDALRCLRRGRMVLDSRTPVFLTDRHGFPIEDISQNDNCSMRLFEGTGCGSLVLALEGTSRWFEWDKEIISYSNPHSLVEKVRYYASHPEERERIAAAGQTRCLEEYNLTRNAQRFLDISNRHLQNPTPRTKPLELTSPNEPKSCDFTTMCNQILSNEYLHELGWFTSYQRQTIVDDTGAPLPWVTYPAVDLLEERVPFGVTVFEYGCGSSTLWWAKRARRVIVVEHDEAWYKTMIPQFPHNVRPIFQHLVRGGKYCQTVAKIKNIKFDVIVIDGRDRANCAKYCIDSLSDTGIVIFDNTEREHYMPGREILKQAGFKELRLPGLASMVLNIASCTSIFYRNKNCLGL